jgi:hypothetical protein
MMRHVNKILLIVIIFIAIPLLYFAAYSLSVRAVIRTKGLTYEGEKPRGFVVFGPEYRCGGTAAELIFAPANWLDHRIQPEFWQTTYELEDETQDAVDVAPNAASNTMD